MKARSGAPNRATATIATQIATFPMPMATPPYPPFTSATATIATAIGIAGPRAGSPADDPC